MRQPAHPLGFLGVTLVVLALYECLCDSVSSWNPIVWGLARGVFPK